MASRAEAPARRGAEKGGIGQRAASRTPLHEEIGVVDADSRGGATQLAFLPEDATSAVRAPRARIVEVAVPRLSALVGRLNNQPCCIGMCMRCHAKRNRADA